MPREILRVVLTQPTTPQRSLVSPPRGVDRRAQEWNAARSIQAVLRGRRARLSVAPRLSARRREAEETRRMAEETRRMVEEEERCTRLAALEVAVRQVEERRRRRQELASMRRVSSRRYRWHEVERRPCRLPVSSVRSCRARSPCLGAGTSSHSNGQQRPRVPNRCDEPPTAGSRIGKQPQLLASFLSSLRRELAASERLSRTQASEWTW